MENASKALIIAGAILLAIVIISLGLVVVNNTRSVTDNANLNAQEIETFNNKFAAYEGKNLTSAQVKSLIQAAIASNAANSDKIVTVNYNLVYSTSSYTKTGTGKAPNEFPTEDLASSKKYSVQLGYSKGLVNTITISENH